MLSKEYSGSTLPADRIISIDLLRGIAVLGILLMNIQSFAMISAAYVNPTSAGDFSGIEKITWILNNLLAREKFINIFSLLFGAGVLLLYQRKKIQGANPFKVQIIRNFWLLGLGLVHAYLIWYGDILVFYSVCGVFVYFFRKLNVRSLFIMGSIFFLVPVLISIIEYQNSLKWTSEEYANALQYWLPDNAFIEKEFAAVKGGYFDLIKYRFYQLRYIHTILFGKLFFWRISALMLMGMGLYKADVFSAKRSKPFYLKLVFIGIPLGLLLTSVGIWQNFHHDWEMRYSMFLGYSYNYFGSIASSMGYIGLVMLIAQSKRFRIFKKVMTSAGRMALTNYILMSIIGGTVFYGIGMGLYGEISRFIQELITVAIWIIILLLSNEWLKRFYYGPLEWLWRFLTYFAKPPFRRR
jgi:uncharacterized protein